MFSWIKARLRDYFGVSKTEANGTLVLLLVTSACLLVPPVLRWYQDASVEVSHAQDVALLEHTLQQLQAMKPLPKPATTKRPSRPQSRKKLQPFDINTANVAQLSTMRGLGPVLSTRIVKFRDKLGGFIRPDQYQEVYGLSTEVVERLQKHAYISAAFQPKKLNINTASLKALTAHPYLTYQQARSLVRYREQHGPFATVEALEALALLDPACLEKVRLYLTAP